MLRGTRPPGDLQAAGVLLKLEATHQHRSDTGVEAHAIDPTKPLKNHGQTQHGIGLVILLLSRLCFQGHTQEATGPPILLCNAGI